MGLKRTKLAIGWNEWCSLPKLGIPAIKAKIDTGAQTSAIHAFDIVLHLRHGEKYVFFKVYPLQGNTQVIKTCKAKVIDKRLVMSSNGHKERRYVITTPIALGGKQWPIEITLSNRDPLRYRMLLGREALKGKVLINPGKTLRLGKLNNRNLTKLYAKHNAAVTRRSQSLSQ